VDLLGDVRQVEVGTEGAHQQRGIGRFQPVEQGGGRFVVDTNQPAHGLHQAQDRFALEPGQSLPEQVHHPADVRAQRGRHPVRTRAVRHPREASQPSTRAGKRNPLRVRRLHPASWVAAGGRARPM
jgi:hypothetical protein